jgi:competence protein ComEA
MRKSLNMIAVTFLMISFAAASAVAAEDAVSSAKPGVVNINTADAEQFALLPRIGVKAGQRIVDYRNQHGPFKSTSDLMQVRGIGDKTFELLSPYLVVEGQTTLKAEIPSPRRARASKKASNSAP